MSIAGAIRMDRIHEDVEDTVAAAEILYSLQTQVLREIYTDPYSRRAVARQYAFTMLVRACWHMHGLREPYNTIGYAL